MSPAFDMIVRGGRVVSPGCSDPPPLLDVGIAGGRIAQLAHRLPSGPPEVDASGGHVLPGFVDVHAHTDEAALRPHATSKLLQGVTTEICGQCGGSPAPLSTREAARHRETIKHEEDAWSCRSEWRGFADYFRVLRGRGCPANQVLFAGWWTVHDDAVRFGSRGLEAAFSALERALDEGVAGVSLHQESDSWRTLTDPQKRRLFALVAGRGRLISVHLASHGEPLLSLIEAFLDLAAETGCRVQLSHLKLLGQRRSERRQALLELLDRKSEVPYRFDVTPFTELCTRARMLGERIRQGGDEQFEWFDRIRWLRQDDERARCGPSWGPSDRQYIVERLDRDPGGLVLLGGLRVEDVDALLAHPRCFVGSDASAVPAEENDRHPPRAFSTFPVAMARRLSAGATWPAIAEQMADAPARWFGLDGRGNLAPGQVADLVVLDQPGPAVRIREVVLGGRHAVSRGSVLYPDCGGPLLPPR
jgi:N-acyl-D-amino-acid deacylase